MWKTFSMKIGGCVKNAPSYLPAQSDQINRCKKKFLLAKHYFCPQITGVYMLKKIEFFRFFEHVKKNSIKIGELVEDDYT